MSYYKILYIFLCGVFVLSSAFALQQLVNIGLELSTLEFKQARFISAQFAAIIEESLKFGVLLIFKPTLVWYVLWTATVFTLWEGIFISGLLLRAVPHFLFAGAFLLGTRKSKLIGFLLALTLHIGWNLMVLIK